MGSLELESGHWLYPCFLQDCGGPWVSGDRGRTCRVGGWLHTAWTHFTGSIQFSSVTQSCPTLCDPMKCSTPGLPVHHQLPESTQTHVHCVSVMPSNHLILCRPLLLLPSIFPSIRVFSNKSALCIRWPKYWSFSFNIGPCNEHPGLSYLRMSRVH